MEADLHPSILDASLSWGRSTGGVSTPCGGQSRGEAGSAGAHGQRDPCQARSVHAPRQASVGSLGGSQAAASWGWEAETLSHSQKVYLELPFLFFWLKYQPKIPFS